MTLIRNKGFLVVEVLIAVSIITAAILSAMVVSQRSVYLSGRSLHALQSVFLLEEGAEVMRALRDSNWDNISSLATESPYYLNFAGGTWSLSASPTMTDGFTRTITVENVNRESGTYNITDMGVEDPDSKLVNIVVSWNEGGEVVSKNLQFYIMNIFKQ